jgi:hypothetical protein
MAQPVPWSVFRVTAHTLADGKTRRRHLKSQSTGIVILRATT